MLSALCCSSYIRLAFVLLSFRFCRVAFKGIWFKIVCSFIEFQIADLSFSCKQYYTSFKLALSNQTQKNNNLLRTVCIYTTTNFTRTISAALKNNTTEGKGARLQFPPTPVGLVPGFVLSESEREARGRHSEARVHTAERLSRKTSCQPPAERKTTGHQPKQFGKRTSQGRFQLAQRVVTAVSHRG